MKTIYLLLALIIPFAFAYSMDPAEEPETQSPETHYMVPGVKDMMKMAPVYASFHHLTGTPFGFSQGPSRSFQEAPGWPIFKNGNPCHGGMLVDMDGDPELEFVVATQGLVRALNPDGTVVPGWPQSTGYSTFSAPAFGDIDGDGEGEVVAHSFYYGIDGRLCAFERDGTTISGFPLALGGTVKGPTLGNIDGESDLEIVSVNNVSGIGHIFVLDGAGNVLPGWPQVFDDVGASSASVGDIDGVPGVEIVAISFRSLYVYDPDGNLLPGFPFTPGGLHTFNYNSPVLADLDKDGDREIIVCTSKEDGTGGRAYVIHHDGTVAAGWPKTLTYPCFIPASVVDLDGDGWLDVLTGDVTLSPTPVNKVYAWDRSGSPLAGFPITPLDALHGQIIVADLDDDGALELCFDQNVAISDYFGYNHDGSPLAGWPLPVTGSSFLGCLSVGDIDGNGKMDLAGTGLDIAAGNCYVYEWNSTFTYEKSKAPLPTYQYNVRRDGIADAFPVPDVKANGSDGPLNITTADQIEVTIALQPGSLDGEPADWWVYAIKDSSNVWWAQYRSGQTPKWSKSAVPIRFVGVTLRTVNSYKVLGPRTLPQGTYNFYFAVDQKNGTYEGTYFDKVDVTVN